MTTTTTMIDLHLQRVVALIGSMLEFAVNAHTFW